MVKAEPPAVTVILVIVVGVRLAVAVAVVVLEPVNPTVGMVVYPLPPFVRVIELTMPVGQ